MAEKHPNELTHAELAEWEAHAEAEWRKAGVEESDIQLSRRNGMDARDNGALRRFTASQGRRWQGATTRRSSSYAEEEDAASGVTGRRGPASRQRRRH